MNNRRISVVFLLLLMLSLGACTPGARIDDQSRHDLNEGYASLYSLMNDESQVSQVLILKSAGPQTKKLIQDISRACDDARRALLDFAKNDDKLGLDKDGMPVVETKTREAISKTTTHDLLGHSNAEFELRLLLTQTEAMRYASHLSEVIAKADPDKDRKKVLEGWSANFERLRERVVAMLTIK